MNRLFKDFSLLLSFIFAFTIISKANESVILSDLISCKRTITPLQDKSLRIEIKITKGKNEGTAKLLEHIPEGFLAVEENSSEGYFAFKNNQVKITWMSLPVGKIATVTYILKPGKVQTNEYSITGKFHYFEDKVTKSAPISLSTFQYEGEEVAESKEAPKETKEIVKESKPELTKAGEAMEPSGIIFKVQIAAGKNEMPQDFFEKTYGITDKVEVSAIGEIYKYTVGTFKDYYAASGHKNSIKKMGIDGAYVVAFFKGKRISVPKALEIQNQSN